MGYYKAGTITVTNGSAAFSGVGTTFLANVKPGDTLQQGSAIGIVATVTSNTAGTLVNAWGGATASNTANYAINHTGDGWHTTVTFNERVNALLTSFEDHPADNANPHAVTFLQALTAMALVPAADKVPYTTGATAAAMMTVTSPARTLLAQTTQALMRSAGLGLADSATVPIGSSGDALGKLNGGALTWSGQQYFTGGIVSARWTLTDDTAGSVAVPAWSGSRLALIGSSDTGGGKPMGLLWIRGPGGPAVVPILMHVATQIEYSTAILTGTTGTDGVTTLSMNANGNFYIENRIAQTRTFSITFIGI
jgi:hypothetical protein